MNLLEKGLGSQFPINRHSFIASISVFVGTSDMHEYFIAFLGTLIYCKPYTEMNLDEGLNVFISHNEDTHSKNGNEASSFNFFCFVWFLI